MVNDMDNPAGAGAPDEDEKLPYPRAEYLERGIARFIDVLIAGAFFMFPMPIGPLAAITYLLIADGISGGASPGKKIAGINVISVVRSGQTCDFRESMLRNAVFAVIVAAYVLVGLIPYVGKLVVVLAGAAAVAAEAAIAYNDCNGLRFGDKVAGTMVVSAITVGAGVVTNGPGLGGVARENGSGAASVSQARKSGRGRG